MAKKNIWSKVGVWSFIAGLVIAVLVGLFTGAAFGATAITVLAILGLIVGLLNVADEEVHLFLLASLVFLVAAGTMSALLQVLPGTVAAAFQRFFAAIAVFVGPAAFVVSLTALYHVAKDR